MKVERIKAATPTEPVIALRDTKPGSILRFQHDSFQEALKADLFWLRLEAPEAKDRVRLANVADGKVIERDGDHRMVVVDAVLNVDRL